MKYNIIGDAFGDANIRTLKIIEHYCNNDRIFQESTNY